MTMQNLKAAVPVFLALSLAANLVLLLGGMAQRDNMEREHFRELEATERATRAEQESNDELIALALPDHCEDEFRDQIALWR